MLQWDVFPLLGSLRFEMLAEIVGRCNGMLSTVVSSCCWDSIASKCFQKFQKLLGSHCFDGMSSVKSSSFGDSTPHPCAMPKRARHGDAASTERRCLGCAFPLNEWWTSDWCSWCMAAWHWRQYLWFMAHVHWMMEIDNSFQ